MEKPSREILRRLSLGSGSPYGIVSLDPPMFYMQPTLDMKWELAAHYGVLFSALQGEPFYVLCGHSWALTPKVFEWLVTLEDRSRAEFPDLHVIHLCNEPGQAEQFLARGVRAVFCNHNCLIDDRIFVPVPQVEKHFDAVYDARLDRVKRHLLAKEISSLALIYYQMERDLDYLRQVQHELAHAHLFNSYAGTYRALTPEAVSESLNQCRVGLCLSEVEGAMFASTQYLLCGLWVVTTPSRGGRDVFFDDRFVLTVPPEAGAVAAAVRELAARPPQPELIRQVTLEKINAHRHTLFSLVQDIYREHGITRNFAIEWDQGFWNPRRGQSHFATIDLIEQARAARQRKA